MIRSALGMALFMLISWTSSCALFDLPTEPGTALFQDDFSNPASGWDRYQDETYISDYFNGSYSLGVFAANTDVWANPGLDFQDIRIEVDATKDAGPDDNVFGIICRYQDLHNFYFFLISSDGYTGIGIDKNGRRKLIPRDTMLPSEAVLRGEATNHIHVECIGYELRLYVNGILVGEARAEEWAHGDVGLIAGTYGQAGTVISFDNFSVTNP